MKYGDKLKLEGRTPTSPNWGVYATVIVEQNRVGDTLEAAYGRAKAWLEKQRNLWTTNYDQSVEFRLTGGAIDLPMIRDYSEADFAEDVAVVPLPVVEEKQEGISPRVYGREADVFRKRIKDRLAKGVIVDDEQLLSWIKERRPDWQETDWEEVFKRVRNKLKPTPPSVPCAVSDS